FVTGRSSPAYWIITPAGIAAGVVGFLAYLAWQRHDELRTDGWAVRILGTSCGAFQALTYASAHHQLRGFPSHVVNRIFASHPTPTDRITALCHRSRSSRCGVSGSGCRSW